MTRFIHTIGFSALAFLMGACETSDSDISVEANEQALSSDDGGASDGFQRRGRGRRGLPPQAIEACADQEEGATCSFDNRRGDSMEGTCINHPRLDGLSCAPEGHFGKQGRHGRRGHRGPPPQAIAACADQEEGATCSFDSRRGDTMEGSCINHPRTDELTCRPEGHFGRGHGRFGEGRGRHGNSGGV